MLIGLIRLRLCGTSRHGLCDNGKLVSVRSKSLQWTKRDIDYRKLSVGKAFRTTPRGVCKTDISCALGSITGEGVPYNNIEKHVQFLIEFTTDFVKLLPKSDRVILLHSHRVSAILIELPSIIFLVD